MKDKVNILLLSLLITVNCFSQTNNSQNPKANTFSNWMSVEYLKCLDKDLPCQCENSKEYFMLSINTAKQFVLLYEGRTNYDYNLYYVREIANNNFEIYDKQYSQTLFRDTVTIIGRYKISNESLLFTVSNGNLTQFAFYSNGDNDDFLTQHVKLLNGGMAARGYVDLNTTIQTDSLRCFCNWELGGINLVSGNDHEWILEKKNGKLLIYEWVNPPKDKTEDLKIEKKLVKEFNW